MPLISQIEQNQDEYIAWRRHIHAHPELAFKENHTADFIEEKLNSFGLNVYPRLAGTGIVASLDFGETGAKASKSIGIRADIDALPIDEQSGVAHSSTHQGVMHACGHDGHTAMLLGAAHFLSQHKSELEKQLTGRVYFVFQPAEEVEGGGEKMVQEGLFDKYPMDAIFAMHNWPGVELGKVAIKPGPVMAAFDLFDITIKGKGGHAAKPHLANDAIVAASHFVTMAQSICSRNTNPLDSVVLSITQFQAGDNYNVIPHQVRLKGTVRSFQPRVQKATEKRLRDMLESLSLSHQVEAELHYQPKYPATINHDKPSDLVKDVTCELLGAENVLCNIASSMGSEDFSFMLNQCPGAYFWIGNGDTAALHNPEYDFNDQSLIIGTSVWVKLVERFLG